MMGSETAGDGAGFGGSSTAVGDVLAVGALGVDERAGAAVIFAGGTERGTVINEARGFPIGCSSEITTSACVGRSEGGRVRRASPSLSW